MPEITLHAVNDIKQECRVVENAAAGAPFSVVELKFMGDAGEEMLIVRCFVGATGKLGGDCHGHH